LDSPPPADEGVLRLTEANVSWLRRSLGVPGVGELDLNETYSFEHALNARRFLQRQELRYEKASLACRLH
jgi:hypothetical protein